MRLGTISLQKKLQLMTDLKIIQSKIYLINGCKVMFDFDLATLYEVETRVLKQAVRRNLKRFPDDFMYQLSNDSWKEVITNCDNLPENIKFSPTICIYRTGGCDAIKCIE